MALYHVQPLIMPITTPRFIAIVNMRGMIHSLSPWDYCCEVCTCFQEINLWMCVCSLGCWPIAHHLTNPLSFENKWQPNQHNRWKLAYKPTTQSENEFHMTWIPTFVIIIQNLYQKIKKLIAWFFPFVGGLAHSPPMGYRNGCL